MPNPADRLDTRHEFQRLKVLQETGLLTCPSLPELDEICRSAKEHFQVAVSFVTLIDRELLITKARAGSDLETAPRVGQFCDYTIRTDEVFVVPDASRDPRFATNPVVTNEPFIRFYAGAPLIYLRDIRLGALCLLDPKPREFSKGDQAELMTMADEAVSVIMQQEMNSGPFRLGP